MKKNLVPHIYADVQPRPSACLTWQPGSGVTGVLRLLAAIDLF